MKKISLLILTLLLGVSAFAQVPALQDTVISGTSTLFTPQFRYQVTPYGTLVYRYNPLTKKYALEIDSKYLRLYYAPATGSGNYIQNNLTNTPQNARISLGDSIKTSTVVKSKSIVNLRDSILSSNYLNPVLVGSTQGPIPGTSINHPNFIKVRDKYAYLVCRAPGSFVTIDVSNPSTPVYLNSIVGPVSGTSLGSANSLAISGRYAYVACSTGSDRMAVIDLNDPANPVWLSETQGTTPGTSLAGASGIVISGSYAYVTTTDRKGLAIIDISNPSAPVQVSELTGFGTPNTGICINGHYLYMSDEGSNCIYTIDISNPLSPTLINTFYGPVPGTSLRSAHDIKIRGKYAYVVCNGSSLSIIDISTPNAPVWVGYITDSALHEANSVEVFNNYAYVSTYNVVTSLVGGVVIVDISNPSYPFIINKIISEGRAMDIVGNYAYLAAYKTGALFVVDVSQLSVTNATIGNTYIGKLSVQYPAQFNSTVSIKQGLNVGDNIFTAGKVSGNNFKAASIPHQAGTATNFITTATAGTGEHNYRTSTEVLSDIGANPLLSGSGLLSFSGSTPSYNTTSAQIASIITDRSGSGKLIFGTAPTLITPVLGDASATSLSITGTAGGGFINLINQIAPTPATPVSGVTIYSTNNALNVKNTSGWFAGISTGQLTFNRIISLPDVQGILASLAGNQTFTQPNTFSNTVTISGLTSGKPVFSTTGGLLTSTGPGTSSQLIGGDGSLISMGYGHTISAGSLLADTTSSTALVGKPRLANEMALKAPLASPSFTGTVNISGLTASKPVFTDASKNLTSTGIGTSSQFIMGDGSLNSTAYAPLASPAFTGIATLNISGATGGTVFDKLQIINSTPATSSSSSSQQFSGGIYFEGQGWAVTPAASQPVGFRIYVIPGSGSSNPIGLLNISATVNGGAPSSVLRISSAGDLSIGNNITVSGISGGSAGNFVVNGGGGLLTTRTAAQVASDIGALTSSTGVTSITGTANQVIASDSVGAVTLSLPQSIATASTPTFSKLTLSTVSGNALTMGTHTATGSTTPLNTDMGATFSSVAGANPKIGLYNDGTNSFGFGYSALQLDYIAGSGASHAFWAGGTKVLSIDGSGNATAIGKMNSASANISGLTASKPIFTDASKNLTSTGPGTSSQLIGGDGSLISMGYGHTISAGALLADTTSSTALVGKPRLANEMALKASLASANTWPLKQTMTSVQLDAASNGINIANIYAQSPIFANGSGIVSAFSGMGFDGPTNMTILTGPLQLYMTTVASLGTPIAGTRTTRSWKRLVSDALNPDLGAIVVGGGSSEAEVYWDGTNWRVTATPSVSYSRLSASNSFTGATNSFVGINATGTIAGNVITSASDIYTGNAGHLYLGFTGNVGALSQGTLTANRNWAFPDASGTVALTTDITANINSGSTQTTVSGSTSGSIVCSQPVRGSTWKKVIIRCAALVGSATYTFPIAFTAGAPGDFVQGGFAVSRSISSTDITVTAASSASGIIVLEGY